MKYAKAARSYIILIALAGIATSLLVIAQTILIAAGLSPVITGHASWQSVAPYVGGLALVALARGLVVLVVNSRAHRAAAAAIVELRRRTLSHAARLGPRWLAKHGIDTVTLTTRGLDDLAPYFINYLPQLLLSTTETPIVLLVIAYMALWSAGVAVFTIFLVPLFMILIGKFTQDFSNRRLAAMQKLGAQLLDLIAGLATLKALGRERGPEKRIAQIGQRYTDTTMSTLRVAFLSGAVLEFIATLSVAMVAVNIGMRMVYGEVDLFTGLIVITLAPEVYLPLREVGKQFHASTDGVTAANKVFEILETEPPAQGELAAPSLTTSRVVFDNVSIAARGRWSPSHLTGEIQPGKIVALDGPSGVGKTTAVMALLGFQDIHKGSITIGDTQITQLDRQTLWNQITWVPQSPAIIAGTVAENIGFSAALDTGIETLSKRLAAAAAATGFDTVLAQLPNGLSTRIGQGGVGLSVGQRQRLALTRALLAPTPLVVLDEPTAHLDAHLEEHVLTALKNLRAQGRTVIMIAHRQAVKNLADYTLTVESAAMTAVEMQEWSEAHTETDSTPIQMPGMLAMLDQEANR